MQIKGRRIDVTAIVLGGGRGTRLYPLTKYRSKPAVPLAGKYRLIDVALSNCINSGIRKIYVLTQFNSASLNRHIATTYHFDPFSDGFVEILAAEQTPETEMWYQGTADAVRKNLRHGTNTATTHILVLSGDALYRQDYRDLLLGHIELESEVTVACKLVDEQQASGFGIVGIDEQRRVVSFHEKPDREALPSLKARPEVLERAGFGRNSSRPYLASMGIYLFEKDVLTEMLSVGGAQDFGREIIPGAIQTRRVTAGFFDGYWEDIGTIRSFFEATLMLLDDKPEFSFYDHDCPIYTHSELLPSSEVVDSRLERAMISEGCLIRSAVLRNTVVGIRSVVGEGTQLENVVMMGADFYESEVQSGGIGSQPPLGIGRDCRISNAIIDKNARIGNRVVISKQPLGPDIDRDSWSIREGIVIVQKNAVIPDGTVI
jgi:glucose-1-phosphate adenylyltransferase